MLRPCALGYYVRSHLPYQCTLIKSCKHIYLEPYTDRIQIDQSRKRGILESDLLLSTFADVYLRDMSVEQLQEYDRFLDENDWDIYYWATQDPPEVTGESPPAEDQLTETWKETGAKSGEWAQTIGAFRAAYRPVPERWSESEVLRLLRQHVSDKSATGFESAKNRKTGGGGGLGRMPNVQVFNS